MAHIKCRYQKEYCGSTERFQHYQKPCNPEIGDTDICECACLELDTWGHACCEHMYLADAEIETDVKHYEFCNGDYDPILTIPKKKINRIFYLEIDGRVLIGEEASK